MLSFAYTSARKKMKPSSSNPLTPSSNFDLLIQVFHHRKHINDLFQRLMLINLLNLLLQLPLLRNPLQRRISVFFLRLPPKLNKRNAFLNLLHPMILKTLRKMFLPLFRLRMMFLPILILIPWRLLMFIQIMFYTSKSGNLFEVVPSLVWVS